MSVASRVFPRKRHLGRFGGDTLMGAEMPIHAPDEDDRIEDTFGPLQRVAVFFVSGFSDDPEERTAEVGAAKVFARRADTSESLFGQRRLYGFVQLEERSPRVRPT